MTMLTKKYKNVTEYLDKEAMQLKLRNYTAKSIFALENGDRDAFWNYPDEVNRFKLDQKEKKSLIKLLKALCEVIKLVEQKRTARKKRTPSTERSSFATVCEREIKFLAVFSL